MLAVFPSLIVGEEFPEFVHLGEVPSISDFGFQQGSCSRFLAALRMALLEMVRRAVE